MYQLNQTFYSNLQASLQNISLKHKEVQLVSLDISRIVDEYCRFITALVGCKKIAEEEYEKVQFELQHIKSLKENVKELARELSAVQTVDNVQINDDGMSQADISENFNQTLERFRSDFVNAINGIESHIDAEVDSLKKFKIVLFGRTKVGKSTVREALTQGNGQSIGKGGQSTTKAINEYNWCNLQVYDTPGILSTKDTNVDQQGIGDEERMANELLQRSDIAIFMFASDNIESAELEYLKEISSTGKEVLILLNVKSDITDYRMYKLRKKSRELDPKAQAGHIKRITEAVPGDWSILPIHAQAAFFSRAQNNETVQSFFKKYGISKDELYELSRFSEIRSFLVNNILKRGNEIRCRTLWDYFNAQIRNFSSDSRTPVEALKDKLLRMQTHINRTNEKVEEIIRKYSSSLSRKVSSAAKEKIDTYDFAYDCIEYDYAKDYIKDAWEKKLEVLNEIPGGIIKEFSDEVQSIFSELKDNLDFELNSVSEFDGYEAETDLSGLFKGAGIITGIAGSGLAVYAAFAAANAWHPGGWLLIGLGVLAAAFSWIGGLFKSKTKKIRELQEKLDDSLADCCNNISEQLETFMEDNVFRKIREIMSVMKKSQSDMLNLCNRFLSLNQSLLEQAEKNDRYLARRVRELKH